VYQPLLQGSVFRWPKVGATLLAGFALIGVALSAAASMWCWASW